MEQHPVPQNVTTFQFRLIGDMTIKQFGYLIAGAILAFIAYKLPLPFIITWPLAGALAFLGVGFAFIPIEERPMDVWVFSFFKSIYNPTQYIWSHEPHQARQSAEAAPIPKAQPNATVKPTSVSASPPATQPSPKTVLSDLFKPSTTPSSLKTTTTTTTVSKPHTSLIDEILSWFHPQPQHPRVGPPTPHAVTIPTAPSVTGYRPVNPASQPEPMRNPIPDAAMHQKMTQLEATLKTLEERLATKTVTENRVLELQKQLTDLLSQKSKTEEELISFKRQYATHQQTAPQPPGSQSATAPQPTKAKGTVNVITTEEGAIKVGLPRLTNVPNIITGLVKDDAANMLPGILVTVTNSEGMPVRALKTNKLGQFAASTQLPVGTYFVEVEDPRGRFTFSRVQITLTGGVVPVLEIIAKSEKALTREKLAQEIFGKPSV